MTPVTARLAVAVTRAVAAAAFFSANSRVSLSYNVALIYESYRDRRKNLYNNWTIQLDLFQATVYINKVTNETNFLPFN